MKVSGIHMTFETAVRKTPPLDFCDGLRALSGQSKHIDAKDTSSISGSVNLDEAYRASQPTASRWDYGIAYRQPHETLYWIEIHPADNRHVDVVIAKAKWLKNWLRAEGRLFLDFPRTLSWVATGSSALIAKDPERQKLAKAGVKYVGNVLHIPVNK